MDDGSLRYVSWSIDKSMKTKPDLVLNNGEWIQDGSGGNHYYKFKNGEFTYECWVVVMSEANAAPGYLEVFQGEKSILQQDAELK